MEIFTPSKISEQKLDDICRSAYQDSLDAEFNAQYMRRVDNKEKVARLRALRIIAPLGRFQEYTDHSYVNNFYKMLKRLSDKYNFDGHLDDYIVRTDGRGNKITGACLDFYTGSWPFRTKNLHLFYEPQSNEADEIFLRGHEETHVLEHLGKIKLLEIVLKEKNVKLNFSLRKINSQLRADLGGFYSLLIRGFHLEEIESKLSLHYDKNSLDVFKI